MSEQEREFIEEEATAMWERLKYIEEYIILAKAEANKYSQAEGIQETKTFAFLSGVLQVLFETSGNPDTTSRVSMDELRRGGGQ